MSQSPKAQALAQLAARTDAYHQAQPRRKALRDDTAMAFWQMLWSEGRFAQARKHWFEVVEPATRLETE